MTQDSDGRLAEPDPAAPDPPETAVDGDPSEEDARENRRRFAEFVETVGEQWASLQEARAARTAMPRRVAPTKSREAQPGSESDRARVPWGVDVAASWGWRLIVIVIAAAILGYGIAYFSVLVIPLVVALLLTALTSPAVILLSRWLPRSLSTFIVIIGAIAAVSALLTFAGSQVVEGAQDLADSVAEGVGRIRTWLIDGPLEITDSQINQYLRDAQDAITNTAGDADILAQIGALGATLTNVFAGFFIALFGWFFFLYDGERIWKWLCRLAPRAAREQVDASGRVAWISLTQFVRATVIVALVDSIGIMIVAALLDVPFVLAIGVLVFLGAFVPLIGATIAGSVAVLVALVDQGLVQALLMAGGVLLVQNIEGQILQPFLMGRWVSVHPLAVILAIGAGVLVAGVVGALVAVPLTAAVNAVVLHLSSGELDEAPLADSDPPDSTDPPDGSEPAAAAADLA